MQRIDFKTEDQVYLHGLLYDEEEKKEKVIIAVHGMGSDVFRERKKAISQKANENEISYFCFNNRGHDLVNYIKKEKDGKIINEICGTTYEDIQDSYYDIKAAIEAMKKIGYKEIYLQGHSLGSTKIVYTYNRLKEEKSKLIDDIKGVILLSLLDIPKILKIYLGENFSKTVEYAMQRELDEIMPKKAFIHPISVKTFLRYSKNYESIDFAKYDEKDFEYTKLQNIEVPIFMRWGNVGEFIQVPADMLSNILKNKLKNPIKDIGYIDGANHSYDGKEEILAKEIIKFLKERGK